METILEKTIREALENNQLEKQMSVIRMEAVKQNISDEELQCMVETERQSLELRQKAERDIQQRSVEAAKRNKYILWGICAVLITLEWIFIFDAHPSEGEKSHLILTLIVNFITLLVVVISATVFFRKNN